MLHSAAVLGGEAVMLLKIIIFILLAAIVFNLFRGLYALVTGQSENRQTVRALTYRVAFSILFFLFLITAGALGWIQPHRLQDVGANHPTEQTPPTAPPHTEQP